MISADLLRAVLVVVAAGVIFLDGPALVVYALAIVTALAGTPFRPAQAALLPGLARDSGELTAANVASSTIESIGFFAGPALGGLLLAVADIPVVYLFNAATFLWSAALVLRIHPVADDAPEDSGVDEVEETPSVGFVREAGAGFATILRCAGPARPRRALRRTVCRRRRICGLRRRRRARPARPRSGGSRLPRRDDGNRRSRRRNRGPRSRAAGPSRVRLRTRCLPLGGAACC